MITQPRHPVVITLALLLALTAVTLVTYWPGASGGFLLDDETSLNDLGHHGGIHDLESLWAFGMSGAPGAVGHPLTMLSFAMDGQSWPTDAYPFLRTNILIHAINGLLIFFSVAALMRLNGREEGQSRWLAFACSALWLLHPLQLSTVLYITQRTTELSTLFTLCGVLLYLHGRRRLDDNPGAGYLYMSTAVLGCTTLAMLSKESGVLLPLYLAVIEFTLLRQRPRPQHWRHWAAVMLGLPILALLVYLFQQEGLYQRLISQPLALLNYLFQIVLPTQFPSLIHDDFHAAHSLLEPFTFAALLSLIAALVIAIFRRKRQPLLSFAILWFLGGHLLEGGAVTLELYSEDRNYLPLLGPLLALVYYGYHPINTARLRIGAVALLCVVLAGISWNHSGVWSDKGQLFATWAEQAPDSLRARVVYTDESFNTKPLPEALALLEQLRADFPNTVGVEIVYATTLCLQGQLTESVFMQLTELAQKQRLDIYVESHLRHMLTAHLKGGCQIPPQALLLLINAVEQNSVTPADPARQIALEFMKLRLYQHYNQTGSALSTLDEIFRLSARIDIALTQATVLLNSNQLQAAQVQLNKAEAMDRLRPRWTPSQRDEIEKLRAVLRERSATSK